MSLAFALIYEHIKNSLFKICSQYGGVQKVNNDEKLIETVIAEYNNLPEKMHNQFTRKHYEELKHILKVMEEVYLDEERPVTS